MRKARYNANQPLKTVCPKCGKKGMGLWCTIAADGIETFRDKKCKYCKYTVMEDYIMEDRPFRCIWVRNTKRMASYNGGVWNYVEPDPDDPHDDTMYG
jgi:hypothetical protein